MNDALIRQIAHICHEANRAWCEENADFSQPVWSDAPIWQIDSAIAGVKFHLANPNAGDDASHNSWMAHKLADGWKWGPNKDPDLKLHPCIVPFTQLPWNQQKKDARRTGQVDPQRLHDRCHQCRPEGCNLAHPQAYRRCTHG
jgi:hypothetical protein